MSQDLGPAQRRLLRFARRPRGVPLAYVADALEVTQRRALKVVESLRFRGKVVVVKDPWTADRRIWTPAAHDEWVRAQREADSFREQVLIYPGGHFEVRCDACGHHIETVTPTRARKPGRSRPESAR